MSIIAIILVVASLLVLFSQFGGRLAAGSALIWWFVALFLLVAVINPMALRPIATFLGVTFVSNFVLAGMIMFLLFQVVQSSVGLTDNKRRLSIAVSQQAVDQFISSYGKKLFIADDLRPKVLVVVPCFNEEASLSLLIKQLNALKDNLAIQIAYCIIDDGSHDNTSNILKEATDVFSAKHCVNIGVSGALRTGFLVAAHYKADWVVQCDADGQHPVPLIPEFVQYARSQAKDLVVGSRFQKDGLCTNFSHETLTTLVSTSILRRLGSLFIVYCLRLIVGGPVLTDPTSGFRVYSRRAATLLAREMPDEYPEPESVAVLALRGLDICEVGVMMGPRLHGRSSIQGLNSVHYIVKVVSALIGLRLRTFFH